MEKLDKNKSGTGDRGRSKRVGKRWQRTKFRLSREKDSDKKSWEGGAKDRIK